jgi:hypothetical protein
MSLLNLEGEGELYNKLPLPVSTSLTRRIRWYFAQSPFLSLGVGLNIDELLYEIEVVVLILCV